MPFLRLGRYLQTGTLRPEYWIAGNEAHVSSISLIIPIAASQAADVEDAFNFFHTSFMMRVKRSFDILVNKFRISERLDYKAIDSAEIIGLAMRLHNLCIENKYVVCLAVARTVGELQEEKRVRVSGNR